MSCDQGGSRGAGRLARSKRCQPLFPLMDLLPVFVCASGRGALRGEAEVKRAVHKIYATGL